MDNEPRGLAATDHATTTAPASRRQTEPAYSARSERPWATPRPAPADDAQAASHPAEGGLAGSASPAALFDLLRTPANADWFWTRVDVTRDPYACWLWQGPEGTMLPTGHIRIWHTPTGSRWLVHRLAIVLAGADIEPGELVRHRCPGDPQPACCRIDHLSTGDALANARDRDLAGRRTPFLPRGERHWSSKISQADADRMRDARRLGIKADDVARLFGISRSTVYAVWSRARYNAAT